MSLSTILTRGRNRFLHVNGEELWIPIKYEKLPKVCFTCGKINHPNSCRPPEWKMSPSQFGPWLWAEPYQKGYSARSRYANFSSLPHTTVNSSSSGKGVDSQSQTLASSTHSETGGPLALWNIRPPNKKVERGESNHIDPNVDPTSVLLRPFCHLPL